MKKIAAILFSLILITAMVPTVFADKYNVDATEEFVELLEKKQWRYHVMENQEGDDDSDAIGVYLQGENLGKMTIVVAIFNGKSYEQSDAAAYVMTSVLDDYDDSISVDILKACNELSANSPVSFYCYNNSVACRTFVYFSNQTADDVLYDTVTEIYNYADWGYGDYFKMYE